MAVGCVIAGGGPAGRALAWACAERGLTVHLVTATTDVPMHSLCAFADELPTQFVAEVFDRVVADAAGLRFSLPNYARLDAAALHQATSAHPLITITVGQVATVSSVAVVLEDGRQFHGDVVVDARGSRSSGSWVQTAFGVRLPKSPQHVPGRAVFMDWTPSPAAAPAEPPTFLYALHHQDGTVLWEETCLASSTPMPMPLLRTRLAARLAARGLQIEDAIDTEEVRIPMAVAVSEEGPLRFGAAAGFVHPATGFSIGRSFAAAQRFASALAGGATHDALRECIWPKAHRRAHHMVTEAMRAVVSDAADGSLLSTFFAAFFQTSNINAFLRPTSPLAVAGLMLRMFFAAPLPLKLHLMRATSLRSVLLPPPQQLPAGHS